VNIAALLIPEDDGGGDEDLRRHARRVKAQKLREALEAKDDDALADVMWPDETDDAEES
jgi:hypothetical protein